jgi:hypothetical protein
MTEQEQPRGAQPAPEPKRGDDKRPRDPRLNDPNVDQPRRDKDPNVDQPGQPPGRPDQEIDLPVPDRVLNPTRQD